jgi:hypothetical protein
MHVCSFSIGHVALMCHHSNGCCEPWHCASEESLAPYRWIVDGTTHCRASPRRHRSSTLKSQFDGIHMDFDGTYECLCHNNDDHR